MIDHFELEQRLRESKSRWQRRRAWLVENLKPLGWSPEGGTLPALHGVAYYDLVRPYAGDGRYTSIRTAWLGLHWLIGFARWLWWSCKRPFPQHTTDIRSQLARRDVRRRAVP